MSPGRARESAGAERLSRAGDGENPRRERPGLVCRGLLPVPLSMERLRSDLSGVAVPVRTVLLMTGHAVAGGPVDAAVVRWSRARARSLAAKLRDGEERAAAYRADAAGLTGLGPGLTPTGDDLLVGLAAMASRLAVLRAVAPGAVAAFAAVLAEVDADRTTPEACRLLGQASEGFFPAVLAAVVETLGNDRKEPFELDGTIAFLGATGAHSGADFLAGALLLARAVAFPGEEG